MEKKTCVYYVIGGPYASDQAGLNTLPAKDGDLRLSASNACLPKTEISVFVTECVFFTSTCYKVHYVHIA